MATPRLAMRIPGTKTPHSPSPFRGDDGKGHRAGEVVIPPGKCVYFWVGCPHGPYLNHNLCREHYYESKGWRPAEGKECPNDGCNEPADKWGGPCGRCYGNAQRRLTYAATRERGCPTPGCNRPANSFGGLCRPCSRKAWADANREKVRAYDRKHSAKKREAVQWDSIGKKA